MNTVCSNKSCPFVRGAAGSEGCVAHGRLREALHTFFKFPDFRPGQLEALLPLLHGRDVFVRMATGAGKSLCIFLGPLAISAEASAVVISPLIGLMDQQVLIILS